MTLHKNASGEVEKIECTPAELVEVLGLVNKKPSPESWVRRAEGTKMIGKNLSLAYAKKHGIEYRQIGKGKRPSYEYNALSIYTHLK